MANWTQDEKEFLKNNYLILEHKEIANRLNRSSNAVRNKCYELGLRKKSEDWTESETDLLRQHYTNTEIDLDELAIRLGRHKTNICRKAREIGLTDQGRSKTQELRKSLSVKQKEWLQNNEHPKGYLGHTHGKETREKIGKKSKEAWANPDNWLNSEENKQRLSDTMAESQRKGIIRQAYSRGHQGKREDLDGLYVRSSWEANYARFLNWLILIGEIKNWEYEVDTFEFYAIKRGSRFYTPDFKVTNKDGSIEYHEVKGWMDQKSQTKLNRMKKYYPKIKLVLIDKDAYRAIEKDVKRFIIFWE